MKPTNSLSFVNIKRSDHATTSSSVKQEAEKSKVKTDLSAKSGKQTVEQKSLATVPPCKPPVTASSSVKPDMLARYFHSQAEVKTGIGGQESN